MKLLMMTLLTTTFINPSFANANTCEDNLNEVRALAEEALDALWNRERQKVRSVLKDIVYISSAEPTGPQLGQIITVTSSVTMRNSLCTAVVPYLTIGAGSSIELIDTTIINIENSEFIKIKVVSNTGTSALAAPNGCEGLVLKSYASL